MAQRRSPAPYSFVPGAVGDGSSSSAASAALASASGQAAAVRAALLARAAAAATGSTATASTGAANTAAAVAANAAGAAAANAKAATSTPSAPPPPAEDAVQDGGDAIDTFSSYVPTALPPCIIRALRERLAADGGGDGGGAPGDTSSAAAAAGSAAASTGSSTSSDSSSEELDVIDLAGDGSAAISSANAASAAASAAAKDDDDSVIEILDTDNEDSTLSFSAGNSNNAPANVTDDSKPSSSPDASASSSQQLFHPTNTTSMPSDTSPAVESALLSSVSAPAVPDEAAATVLDLVRSGNLSPLQAEGVTLAIHRFNRVFTPNGSTGKATNGGTRAGFFLGDGAGIGKGRQISATIRDALCRNHGRGRHLWISVSRELVQDAKRDLADVGCHVDVHDGADVLDQMSSSSGGSGKKGKGLGAGGSLGKGVLFITYSLLVSGKRVEDIIRWLAGDDSSLSSSSTAKKKSAIGGAVEKAQQALLLKEKKALLEQSYTGTIVFDECHKAKNLEADTRTAKLVLALQERLPNARVLYCSATGVSDIKHMAYATRLGLWGAANPLYPTFDSFKAALAKRGVGAMEMLALEMKRKGLFLARTLSWDGAVFDTLEVKLTKKQVSSYDGAVQWWFDLKNQITAALALMDMAAPKTLWRAYWSAHQRFFREMCICAKVDEVTEQAKKYLAEDHAVVIGLQSTGEAGMEVALEELAESLASDPSRGLRRSDSRKIDFEDVALTSLVSTCASIMTNFVRNHFPIALPPPEVPKVPEIPPNGFASEMERSEYLRLSELAERIKAMPDPEPIPELVEHRRVILESISSLDVPANPLDQIIDRLGGVDNVAEMTGRSGRILRDAKTGMYHYVKRFGGPSKQKSYGLSMPVNREDENDRLNIVEKRKFMEGKKSVAIISDAASTGISLHADRRSEAGHKRRVHFTIELPWAADKAIQQLGRTHRSGQRSAPIYKMVVTELGGERRFAAAVSKRMASLGALTKGDRRAATGTDLSDFDIDSIFGRRALNRVYIALREKPSSAPCRNANVFDDFLANSQLRDQDEASRRSAALLAASEALDEVGLTGEPVVKVFLNRIAGLDVSRQNLVFSLFMSTLDDVITDAKATGEFEGSVEDVKATTITLKETPKVIATDASCGATTTLTKIELDRGISFDNMIQTIISGEEEEGKGSDDEDMSDDDEEEEQPDPYAPAESGFYISRRKIAGRHLIMFAQRKVVDESGIDSDFIDPLGLMIVSRPNTGKNPCEMASRDLRYKYNLLCSTAHLLQLSSETNGEEESSAEDEKNDKEVAVQPSDIVSMIRAKYAKVAKLWDEAYESSNYLDHNMGLAPRRSQIGLITGAVLHILPALEKAVLFLRQSQRSLRVMRVELSNSGQRVVGIKFPIDNDALGRLTTVLKEVSDARKGSLDALAYVDEKFSLIDEKAMAWATAERKTMKSFFGAAVTNPSSSSSSSESSTKPTKRKQPSFVSPHSLNSTSSKKTKTTTKAALSTKKKSTKKKSQTKNISSFFEKKY